MSSDPFGLRSVEVAQLRSRYGAKWSGDEPRFAAWIADMDFPIAPAITDRLGGLIDRGELGYPPFSPRPNESPAAAAFVDRMGARYGWHPDPGRLIELNDVIQGVQAVIHHQSEPGDGIVLHMPAYHPFLDTIDTAQRKLIEVEWGENGFDYDLLEQRLAVEPAKVWILCHPHNPLGHVFERPELERIADIATRHGLLVISDEIHADLTYAPSHHLPFESIAATPRVVTVTSASKAFNLAGLRWAVLHCRDDQAFGSLAALPGHYLGAVNTLAVEATVAAWTEGADWLAAVIAQLDANRHLVAELVDQHFPGAEYRPPDATYLAWIDLNHYADGALGDDPAAAFRAAGVEVSPGLQFGPSGAGHIRFNFATSPAVIEATFAAMASVES